MPKIAAVPLTNTGAPALVHDDDIAAAIEPTISAADRLRKERPKTPAQRRALDQAEVAHLAFLDAQTAYARASDERARAWWNATRAGWLQVDIAARCTAHGTEVKPPAVRQAISKWRAKMRREASRHGGRATAAKRKAAREQTTAQPCADSTP
jgi:hypothetical protein